ncbi:MAG TPA: tetraacyldisaccharide 4'-kinase [Planctomycetaceae bacterium]|nr:tetraacyldisaccharide 4'-kinase [Planctomycetaceae bacterium]
MNGRRRDPLAFLFRGLLWLFQFPYWIVITFRNLAYDRRWYNIQRCDVAVISIGNLTTGGTGKTPLVRYTARLLREHDYRVALVSRGYGSVDGADNDEAMELAATLPDVPHLQNPDRVASAQIAVEELESQVILMDDGFQHRRLHRDLDVLVIDATCPLGFGHLLPRGLLREPVSSAKRAAAAVLTRSDAVDEATRKAIRDTILRRSPNIVWAETVHRPTGLLQWPDSILPLQRIDGQPVAIVCGIGNPDAFTKTAKSAGATVVQRIELPDHDAYDQETVTMIRQRILEWGDSVTQILCTHKDLVKIQTDSIAGKPLLAIQIEIDFTAGKAAYDELVLDQLAGNQAP